MRQTATLVLGLLFLASSGRAADVCPGDCDGDREVTIDEIVRGIGIVFNPEALSECAAMDPDSDGRVTVAEILQQVNAALEGCPLSTTACNGADELCSRRYDQVSYPTTHNAMANADDGWVGPNQTHDVARQLRDGVRALMLDTHPYLDGVYLCHSDCAFFGHRRLAETLTDIRAFLDQHPREVVTIIFEAYVSAAQTEGAFVESGLLDYVHVQPLDQPWPTLHEMIASGKRLVVFSDNDRGARPWYHYVWDYAFETNFSYEKPQDLSCATNRGDPSHSLFILNHFLTRGVGHINLARLINYNPLFADRALQCQEQDERLPNFVTVDFYNVGDLFQVVSTLNGLDS